MNDIFSSAPAFLKAGEAIVLARIVESKGSTPRTVGAGMILRQNGHAVGTVGGGPMEAAVIRKAAVLFETRHPMLFSMELSAETVAETAMICGGGLTFLCEYIPPAESEITFFESVGNARANHREIAVCSAFQGRNDNLRCLGRCWTQDGRVPPDFPNAKQFGEVLKRVCRQSAGSTLLASADRIYCIDVLEGRPPVYIFGAGHVAREIADLASHVGFRVIVLDDRADFASPDRFPPPTETKVLGTFSRCLEKLPVDADSYVVIVTRGHAHDKTVLAQALKTEAGYIGMIGSRKKRDHIYASLLAEGYSEARLERVRSPIGLPIAAETPEEIAVSIVGELIDHRSRRRKWIGRESRQ